MALSSYRNALERRFAGRLRLVLLFGSWARGEATDRSDVDVAVVIDQLAPNEWAEAVRLAGDVELEFDLPVSPFVVSFERFEVLKHQPAGIGSEILRDGVAA